MNQNHLISVIVSTYNRSEFLRKTIDSILNQTYRNFELIIVDDGAGGTNRKAALSRVITLVNANIEDPTALAIALG